MRALVSTFYKDGIDEFCKFLSDRGVEIISTGGTYKFLLEKGIPVVEVKEITGFDEILDGRVKTLHPNIHGGILAIRDNEEHMNTIKERGIGTIDFVVVNLYPFFEKVQEDLSFEEKIEFIDIGGPSMLRAAAKNFRDVVVLCDYNDYEIVMKEIDEKGNVSFETRKYLAGKVFNLTSSYDAAISNFLLDNPYPEYLSLSYKKEAELRYGENPHQTAAFYVKAFGEGAMKDFEKLSGKELSYNNIKDMDVAWKVVCEFDETACCAVKHNTPCGVAIGENTYDAFLKTFECDPVSIFGGIVAFNKRVDKDTAQKMAEIFLEVIIAPEYDEDALNVLFQKKNLRVIKANVKPVDKYEIISVDGGILIQSVDDKLIDDLNVVTEKEPSREEIDEMLFGMKVVKYVKSNAIVVVKDKKAVGIASGQVNRIWAACQALERGKGAAVLVSDAFFPFSDVVEEAAKNNIKAIMQPGGSLKDKDSIEACNKHGISMVFTGVRHFKH
ncbi:Bifunctional purine biosynthesis protein PurH [Caloramator mitchellensis]|uniref:Bifunctional purine biosynthesis protein PurH n=1 Tax=Caloramator mitchellensis TaxID=908809 RepID=A0A0R3JRY8_CALMK|nr:bifunctional phosphoribosylaminoimidazolecarboxamide formyltransferase/IMP cyclohydrolase [Caloramator mitchellensis]KRQ86241.1 Bifunctional purine biosynthesis protein PurH [Caloramator mitchellensis]